MLARVEVRCDDDNAVTHAGLLLPATLAQHLGIEALADGLVRTDRRQFEEALTEARPPVRPTIGATERHHYRR